MCIVWGSTQVSLLFSTLLNHFRLQATLGKMTTLHLHSFLGYGKIIEQFKDVRKTTGAQRVQGQPKGLLIVWIMNQVIEIIENLG